jgi:hypothetical protein
MSPIFRNAIFIVICLVDIAAIGLGLTVFVTGA